ncbi:DUF3466 family protein [Vibrio vulnificus]|uniref:DUF3466 family protein n=1 Tax=Vibrio vulnificus TaxID=672 RepID=UPI0009B643D1|nr:DUF3466 family protein [Vibrio vulnificus]ASJ38638.1 hypothetical protein VVCECT4999_08015 [Vibrio vulnificus]EGQ8027309.1 DUF3466 family protein [Vibrio vulnificus]EHD2250946.1 DUF3466 family protein [Vibrio vulnificus]EHH0849719.1 DUF3466 family protein [Vibrio vulnificus]EHH2473902.1 DUF3466 family protein [Vibrio vulnificus]
MNCSTRFKLTTVALLVGSAMNANAALYKVVEVDPALNGSSSTYNDAYGVAIQQGDVAFETGCFANGANCTDDQFKLALETRVSVDGVSYREELPFAMDATFGYIQEFDDFERYCYNELRYSTCETWASIHWAPWYKELSKDYTSNALAFVEKDLDAGEEEPNAYQNKYNNVINSLTSSGLPVGNQSVLKDDKTDLETRNTVVAPVTPQGDFYQSRAWKTDGTYTVGSVSSKTGNENGTHYTSKAAIWDAAGVVKQLDWPQVADRDGERLAQGSMRDVVVDDKGDTDPANDIIYGVGYNTYLDDNYINASVFVGTFDSGGGALKDSTWRSKAVVNAEMKNSSGDIIHSNSVVTNVNSNFIAIGEAKRAGGKPSEGSAANRLFLVKDVRAESVSATFLPELGGIFFSGAGGKMGGINKYNEIVGQLDAEDTREIDGKPRRKRAFILPYEANGSVESRISIFDNKAWYLDDLTNGSNAPVENNQYRIIDATDINDAGVISATAIKCEGGYDTTAHNSYCGEGSKEETVVAVKLIPIADVDASNINTRPVEKAAAERSGAGLGWLSLTLLVLFGFRRK